MYFANHFENVFPYVNYDIHKFGCIFLFYAIPVLLCFYDRQVLSNPSFILILKIIRTSSILEKFACKFGKHFHNVQIWNFHLYMWITIYLWAQWLE